MNMRPMMTKRILTLRIISHEIIGFLVVATVLWMDEVFDLPHNIFGAPATPVNWVEAVIESSAVLILGAFIVLRTFSLLRHVRYLEGFLPVCAFCKKIRVGEEWKPIEVYLSEHSEALLSHGFCPDCAAKHYGQYLQRLE